jgi:hypothetical protein
MNFMYETLVRERMKSAEHDARQARLAVHLVAARRWRRLERMAHRAHVRHNQRAELAHAALRG